MTITFRPGDTVYWTSNASRRVSCSEFTDQRQGIFLCVIPSDVSPLDVAPQEYIESTNGQCNLGYGKSGSSSQVRALIRVDRSGVKGPLKPHYFAPRLNSVRNTENKE